MQRLFSTFANGWPGAGILLQRVLTATILIYCGLGQISEGSYTRSMLPEEVGVAVGFLLLIGLWTPVAGLFALVVQVWIYFIGVRQPLAVAMSGMLGLTIAMIGPGAWSLDALIFGRKHIQTR